MKRELINISETGSLSKLATIRKLLVDVLEAAGVNQSIESKVLICFSELYTNCVEHAGAENIQVLLSLDSHSLILKITDDGNRDSTQSLSNRFEISNGIQEFDTDKESGRGLDIVKHLGDHVVFSEVDDSPDNQWQNSTHITWDNVIPDFGTSVLIVEDDPALRCLYENYLVDKYIVHSCENGAAAVKRLKTEKINVIVSDINMPIMNGIELRDVLAKEKRTELIPFIFLSFEEDTNIIEHARLSGVDDLLKKPCDKKGLTAVVERVLMRFNTLSQRFNERIDRNVSAALQPKLPEELGTWTTAIKTRNTGGGGGDVVMHFTGKERQFIILLDIIGHDETAKFFSYAYSGYIKGLMLGSDYSIEPNLLLSQLSNMIVEDSLLCQLGLTCCVIELSGAGRMRVASAGHPPPLLISDEGVQPLEVSGMLLGLVPNQQYHCESVVVKKSQRIAVYTDGLVESANTSLGRSQLESDIFEVLAANHQLNITNHLDSVFAIFDHHTKSHALDDALLILVETNE